jgi:protein-disulfide isomerase
MSPVDRLDHTRGAPDPAVVIVQYGDYDCPHTRAAQAVMEKLLREFASVSLVFRHFPLRQIHPNAESLARIAEASTQQGKFWEMHDRLMTHRRAIDESDVLKDAREVGVDMERVRDDIAAGDAIAKRIERDVLSGRASGVHSTPSFFFNDTLHDGHSDYSTLKARLQEALAS